MRLYKLGLIIALALGSLLVCTNLSSAQEAGQGKKKGGFSPQQRVDRLATELNLTEDQKTKILPIFQDEQKKFQELRADQSIPRDQMREKMRTIREDGDKKLKAILKPDQWDKYEKMREEMRTKGGGKKGKKSE